MHDEDDPLFEINWLQSSRMELSKHLDSHKIEYRKIDPTASWHVCPYVSIWRVRESSDNIDGATIWGIVGDLPTDFIKSKNIITPRDAMREFAKRWLIDSELMMNGKEPVHIAFSKQHELKSLGELLYSRADILNDWSSDDSRW